MRVIEAGEVIKPLIRELGYSTECSACSGQYSEQRYIDFDAAHDGGFYGGEAQIVKDDLALCESCVKAAASQLGMTDDGDLKGELEHLREQLANSERERRKVEEYADRIEDAFEHRPKGAVHVDHRKKPRKRASEEE